MSGGRTKRVMFLLAPAKTLDFSRAHKDIKTLPATTPRLLNKGTQDLLAILKKQSASDLKTTLKVSPKLAELNYGRYQGFEDAESLQSALCFDGQAYQGLLAWEFDQASLEWLNERLRILSGLYGVIRPFDLTKAYRLEMGTKLANPKGDSLYDFWGSSITDLLLEDLSPGDVLVNTASKEYSNAVQFGKLRDKGVHLYEMDFEGATVHKKIARGAIVRYAVEQRVGCADDLKSFVGRDGEYAFSCAEEKDVKNPVTKEVVPFTVFKFEQDRARIKKRKAGQTTPQKAPKVKKQD